MNFIKAIQSDVGIRKKVNQDSLLFEQAETDQGSVLLAAICDGMGGLQRGELASASMIGSLYQWFYGELPELISPALKPEALKQSWMNLVNRSNQSIREFGEKSGIRLGTTCVAVLAFQGKYYIMNVGDSRAYLITDRCYQLTRDQTYCQREIDAGRMTVTEAMNSPRRSMLLQCIGVSADYVYPDFYSDELGYEQCILLCSDGFRHLISPKEMHECLNPQNSFSSKVMQQNLLYLTELMKSRNECDNISAILLKAVTPEAMEQNDIAACAMNFGDTEVLSVNNGPKFVTSFHKMVMDTNEFIVIRRKN